MIISKNNFKKIGKKILGVKKSIRLQEEKGCTPLSISLLASCMYFIVSVIFLPHQLYQHRQWLSSKST